MQMAKAKAIKRNAKEQAVDGGVIKKRKVGKEPPTESSKPRKAEGKPQKKKYEAKPSADRGAEAATKEKPNWSEFKKNKKELRLKRRQTKDIYELTVEAKQIYEQLKCHSTKNKATLAAQLLKLFNEHDAYAKLVMAHDTTRILQCMLRLGGPDVHDALAEKLLPHAVAMCRSKYSHFCVLAILKYCSNTMKAKLVDSLYGHIVKLCCHRISSTILDHIYVHVASAVQKAYLRQEFYGGLYRTTKDSNVTSVACAYKDDNNAMKTSVLSTIKAHVNSVANKELLDNSLVHAVIHEYLEACNDEHTEEAIDMLAGFVPLLLTTKEGARAATICFYKASSKQRRAILKSIKEHLLKIATHEHGHAFLIAVVNALDDTKATKKVIYDGLHNELTTLVEDAYGRRVISWLVTPANTKCNHPSFINAIEQGLQYGKKDKEVRRKEIYDQVVGPITDILVANPQIWLRNKNIALFTAEIVNNLNEPEFGRAAAALAGVITQPNWRICDPALVDKTTKKTFDVEKIIELATQQRKANKLLLEKANGTSGGDVEAEQKAVEANNATNEVSSDEDDDSSDDDDDNSDENENDEQEQKADVPVPETADESLIEGITDAGMNFVLHKIIKFDEQRQNFEKTFGLLLVEHLTADVLKYWVANNRSCFTLLNIVERSGAESKKKLKSLVKTNKITINASTNGGQLLEKKLNN